MGKSKKKKNRNDTRGYGGAKGPQNGPSQSAASSKDVVVTKQTHEGIQSLVDQLKSSQIQSNVPDDNAKNATLSSSTASSALPTAESTIRFIPKLTKIVDRLIDLGFEYDPDEDKNTTKSNCGRCFLEEMVAALGYGITLESALDWLCLNVPTLELPPLFTDGNLRNNLLHEERQGTTSEDNTSSSSSLTVLKFVSSTPLTESRSGLPTEAETAKKEEEIKQNEIERRQQQERMEKRKQDKQIAKEKAEAEERAAAKKKVLEQYAEYADESESDEEHIGGNNDGATDTRIPLSPQEMDLLGKKRELNELEVDLGCEANNYMRSKQEMKLMRNQLKKLKQQVAGLRRKVENIRRQREKEEEESKPQVNEESEDETGGDFFGGGGFFGEADADEDEEDEDEEDEANVEGRAQMADAEEAAKVLIDCPIPKGWTGTTPRKTLEDTCRKQKLGKPKFLNLGVGSTGGYKLSGINIQKAKKVNSNRGNGQNDAAKEEWIAMKCDFTAESSLPDYLALEALYEIDSNKPLYGMFPPAFRSLWLSKLEEVKQQNDEFKQAIEKKKNQRIEKLLHIIKENHKGEIDDVRAENTNKTNDGERSLSEEKHEMVEDSWEDMDDSEDYNAVQTSKPSKAGEKLKLEFIQRQSTKDYAAMLRQRENLPMTTYRSEVLETVKQHQVTILCAETVSEVKGSDRLHCI